MPPCAPPSGKILTYAQVLANIYTTVNFQLRSSSNAGLTERSLYNRFCIEMSPKMGFWGTWEGLIYLVGTPYECNDRRSTSFCDKVVEML